MCGLLLFLPNDFLPFACDYVFVYPYFVLGYLANRYGLPARIGKTQHGVCFVLCLLLFLLLFPRFHYSAYVYTSMTCVLGVPDPFHQFLIDGYRWAIGLAGCVTALYVLHWLWRRAPEKLRAAAVWLGSRTLGLYVASTYLCNQLLTRVSASWPPSWWLNALETAALLAVSILIVRLLEGWRWTRRAFLGRWDG